MCMLRLSLFVRLSRSCFAEWQAQVAQLNETITGQERDRDQLMVNLDHQSHKLQATLEENDELAKQHKVLERRCVTYNTQIANLRESVLEQKAKVQSAENDFEQLQTKLGKQQSLVEA